MIGVKDFKEWLSRDISISTEIQKIITKKLSEYIELNSIDGKIIEAEIVDLIS